MNFRHPLNLKFYLPVFLFLLGLWSGFLLPFQKVLANDQMTSFDLSFDPSSPSLSVQGCSQRTKNQFAHFQQKNPEADRDQLNINLFKIAIKNNDLSFVRSLLRDPSFYKTITTFLASTENLTPSKIDLPLLTQSILKTNPGAVQLLLELGAKVNDKNQHHSNLFYATKKKYFHPSVLKSLYSYRARFKFSEKLNFYFNGSGSKVSFRARDLMDDLKRRGGALKRTKDLRDVAYFFLPNPYSWAERKETFSAVLNHHFGHVLKLVKTPTEAEDLKGIIQAASLTLNPANKKALQAHLSLISPSSCSSSSPSPSPFNPTVNIAPEVSLMSEKMNKLLFLLTHK